MNLLGFSYFEPKKCFWVPTPWGLYGAEWDERWAVYAVSSHFCYVGGFGNPHSEGCEWGCCNSICLLGYGRALFAVSSLAESLSQPLPKTRNDCGGALSAVRVQCARSATIWASGHTRDPYFEILGAPRGIMVTPSGGFDF